MLFAARKPEEEVADKLASFNKMTPRLLMVLDLSVLFIYDMPFSHVCPMLVLLIEGISWLDTLLLPRKKYPQQHLDATQTTVNYQISDSTIDGHCVTTLSILLLSYTIRS